MLHEIAMQTAPEEEALKAELRAEREQLSKNQNRIKDAGLPVMVVFEGWGAAGKGSIIGKVIKNIDPRFFRVCTMEKKPSEEEKRYPFLYRYLLKIPEPANKNGIVLNPATTSCKVIFFIPLLNLLLYNS